MAGRKRRGWGEDSIYFDHASDCRDPEHHWGCVGRWRGSVSIMSERGIPVEEIARLVGHRAAATTEAVYRRELRPVISIGAEVMDTIFRID